MTDLYKNDNKKKNYDRFILEKIFLNFNQLTIY